MSGTVKEFAGSTLWYSEDGGTITVGVTQHSLSPLGSIQNVDLPEVGDFFESEEWVGEVVGENETLPVLAPLELTVTEINQDLDNDPQHLEDDPMGDAWLFRATAGDANQ